MVHGGILGVRRSRALLALMNPEALSPSAVFERGFQEGLSGTTSKRRLDYADGNSETSSQKLDNANSSSDTSWRGSRTPRGRRLPDTKWRDLQAEVSEHLVAEARQRRQELGRIAPSVACKRGGVQPIRLAQDHVVGRPATLSPHMVQQSCAGQQSLSPPALP